MDFQKLILSLSSADVRYIIVGGMAATVHGSSRLTADLDVVYDRSLSNLSRVVESLAPLNPYLRGAPEGLPFNWDQKTLQMGLNFTLKTDAGPIDLLGEISGGGNYQDLLPHSIELSLFGQDVKCLGLDALIQAKRAAGRPKDMEVVAELETIKSESGDH